MPHIRFTAAAWITLTGVAFAAVPIASAAPSGSASAAETIDDLRAQGYTVQVNGTRNGPLSNCSVDAVRNAAGQAPVATVYVDLSCPAGYQD